MTKPLFTSKVELSLVGFCCRGLGNIVVAMSWAEILSKGKIYISLRIDIYINKFATLWSRVSIYTPPVVDQRRLKLLEPISQTEVQSEW